MELFSPVQILPDPGRHGKLWYTLPWSVLDFFDLGAFFIHEKDHIDQDGHTVLENLARTIHQLIVVFDERAQIDSRLLGEIIPYLRQIEEERHPIKIFFPQIHAKTAPLDRGAERKRIEAAKDEAGMKAACYKKQAVGLLGLLVPTQQPGRGAPDSEVIRQLKAFEKLCETASYEQQGLVAKALNFVSKKVIEKAREVSQAFFRSKIVQKDESCGIAGNHPLVQLLSLLSDQTFRSGVDIEARVKDALPRLEQYHPSFKGVQQYVEKRVKAPFTDFRTLRQALHQFLMLQWIPKVNPHDYLQDALIHVYTTARKLGLNDAPHPHVPERVELDWMLSGIEERDDAQTNLAREICTAHIGYQNELMQVYKEGLRRETRGVPTLNKSDQEKIEWATRNLRSPSEANTARECLEKAASQLEHELTSDKKVEWAIRHLKAVWAQKFIPTFEAGQNLELDDACHFVEQFDVCAGKRDQLLIDIAAKARSLSIGSVPQETARPDQIAHWLSDTLRLRDHLEHRDFVRMVYRFNGTIKTPDEIDRDLLDFYEGARVAGVAGVPDQYTEASYRIEWARQVINGEVPCDKEALDPLITAIREDLQDQFVTGLIHFHGVLRRNESVPETHDVSRKMAWGQEQVKRCFVHLFHPENPEEAQSAELVWMATAHYQQLSELHHIRGEILRQKGTESIQTILHSINLLIKALEMQPDLLGTERAQELTAMVVQPTLDWVTVAHDFLRSGQISTLKQGEVDQQFEPIYREIRAAQVSASRGSYLEAFKQLKVVLEKSPLSTKLLEQGMDRASLEQLEQAFGIFLKDKPPQKPSALRGEVLEALGKPAETLLTKEVLVEGVELQRKRMISNGLVLAGYKILTSIFKGPKGRNTGLRQSFASYRTAVDTIAGERNDYDPTRVVAAVRAMVGDHGYSLSSQEGQEMLQRVHGAITEVRRRFEGEGRLQSEQAQEALHETTYQNLLSVLITVNAENHTLASHIARALLPLFLWGIKLFSDPFSKTLIEKFTQDIILESNGQLTDTHLHPINGLNQGLGTYNEKMRRWGEVTAKNAVVDASVHSSLHDVPVSGQSAAMEAMLQAPRTYPGRMTHTQIDQWGLYVAVDQYLHVANLCQDIDQAFKMIRNRLMEKNHDNPLIDAAGYALKGLLSVFPYLFVWGQYILLQVTEVLANFALQQIVKFGIWYTQAGTEILMRFINALVKSSEYTTGLDKILLEKLKELEQDLEREARLAKGEDRGPSSVNHEPIRSLLSHVKETVETIKCDTPQDARELREEIQGLSLVEAFATDQVKKLIVPMMISTIESFLNQESMLLALYRGFDLMNQGLREETPQLERAQMAELEEEVRLQERVVTPEDISDKMRRVHQGLSREMQGTLKRILENAAYPTIDRKIDQSIKFPGQVVSECIGWLEKALYVNGTSHGVDSENIIVRLEARLGELDTARRDRGEILRDLYMDFSHFIKEFREHQTDIDQNPSYNGILLKKDVFQVIAAPLNPLAIALAQFIKDPEGGGKQAKVVDCIRSLKETTTQNLPTLNKLRDSEAWNHDERHRGVLGQTLGSWERLFTHIKEQAKAPVHEGLNRYVGLVAENLTAIPKKPVLVQHLVRSVMVPYIRANQ